MQLLPSCEQLLTLYVDCLRVTDSRVDFVSTPALHYCAPSFPTFLASLQYSRRGKGRFEVILCGVETVVFSLWNNFYFLGEINSFFFSDSRNLAFDMDIFRSRKYLKFWMKEARRR